MLENGAAINWETDKYVLVCYSKLPAQAFSECQYSVPYFILGSVFFSLNITSTVP